MQAVLGCGGRQEFECQEDARLAVWCTRTTHEEVSCAQPAPILRVLHGPPSSSCCPLVHPCRVQIAKQASQLVGKRWLALRQALPEEEVSHGVGRECGSEVGSGSWVPVCVDWTSRLVSQGLLLSAPTPGPHVPCLNPSPAHTFNFAPKLSGRHSPPRLTLPIPPSCLPPAHPVPAQGAHEGGGLFKPGSCAERDGGQQQG